MSRHYELKLCRMSNQPTKNFQIASSSETVVNGTKLYIAAHTVHGHRITPPPPYQRPRVRKVTEYSARLMVTLQMMRVSPIPRLYIYMLYIGD